MECSQCSLVQIWYAPFACIHQQTLEAILQDLGSFIKPFLVKQAQSRLAVLKRQVVHRGCQILKLEKRMFCFNSSSGLRCGMMGGNEEVNAKMNWKRSFGLCGQSSL